MPRMSDPSASTATPLVKALIIGDGKCGKTDWAARAAQAGFNLLYMDGDVGHATVSNMIREKRLDMAAASRIWLMDIADNMLDGARNARMIDVMKEFSSVVKFGWNDTEQRLAKRSDPESDECWAISPGRMDSNSVFVLDSWTGLTESIMLSAGIANSVDISEASTSEMRPVYQAAGLKATQMLQVIRSMRCHVIVIAHPDEFTHTTKKEGAKLGMVKEAELTIDWTKMIPKSTSKPHGMQMSKYFTDVLWLGTNASGSTRMVDARVDSRRVSGGHLNEWKDTEEYSFANLVKAIGGQVPVGGAPTDSWLEIYHNTTAAPKALIGKPNTPAQSESAKVLDGTVTTQVKSTGMASLLKKPAPAV